MVVTTKVRMTVVVRGWRKEGEREKVHKEKMKWRALLVVGGEDDVGSENDGGGGRRWGGGGRRWGGGLW